jgi:hypothetical protein
MPNDEKKKKDKTCRNENNNNDKTYPPHIPEYFSYITR